MTTIIRQMTIRAVLASLAAAGSEGLITTTIAQSFDLPATYQQRSNRASQILRELGGRDYAEKLGTEPSPLYRNTPVSRWRITDSGTRRHEAVLNAGSRRAVMNAVVAASAECRREALAGACETIAKRYQTGLGITRCFRRKIILDLRQVPCTLAEIGELFGLQRERVRQIEMGLERPCACRECITGPDTAAPPGVR
jgi:hypothetical protein